jgi:hypothetical protein
VGAAQVFGDGDGKGRLGGRLGRQLLGEACERLCDLALYAQDFGLLAAEPALYVTLDLSAQASFQLFASCHRLLLLSASGVNGSCGLFV